MEENGHALAIKYVPKFKPIKGICGVMELRRQQAKHLVTFFFILAFPPCPHDKLIKCPYICQIGCKGKSFVRFITSTSGLFV
jgi:hypothetical protein